MREQELLLGYLMNALDDHETALVEQDLLRQPRLRAELAELQRQIAPLDHDGDSVLPPPLLAAETCKKIWAAAGQKKTKQPEFLLKNVFEDTVMLPASQLLKAGIAEPELSAAAEPVPPAAKNREIPKSSRWIGLIASVAVGMVIAFLLFPMVRYAKRSTQTYITQTQMSEINQRVDHYEQIHGNKDKAATAEESVPLNLAVSGWEELLLQPVLPFCPQSVMQKSAEPEMTISADGRQIFSEMKNEPALSLEKNTLHEPVLLWLPDSENPVRSAYGQSVLLRNGRVFFRILPDAKQK